MTLSLRYTKYASIVPILSAVWALLAPEELTILAVIWPPQAPTNSHYLGDSYREWREGEKQPPKPAKQKKLRNKRSRRSLPYISIRRHTNDHQLLTNFRELRFYLLQIPLPNWPSNCHCTGLPNCHRDGLLLHRSLQSLPPSHAGPRNPLSKSSAFGSMNPACRGTKPSALRYRSLNPVIAITLPVSLAKNAAQQEFFGHLSHLIWISRKRKGHHPFAARPLHGNNEAFLKYSIITLNRRTRIILMRRSTYS